MIKYVFGLSVGYGRNYSEGGVKQLEWTTVYEISQSYFPVAILLDGCALVVCCVVLITDVFSFINEKAFHSEDIAKFVVFCLVAFFFAAALISEIEEYKDDTYKEYLNAYTTKNYSTIEGFPVLEAISNGGFSFSIDNIGFTGIEEAWEIESILRNQELIKVYYFDKELYDPFKNQYVFLRIDLCQQ